MLETFTAGTFRPLLSTTFTLHSPAAALELALVEVRGGAEDAPSSAPRRNPFSIVLTGPVAPLAAQGSYRFEHPALGSFEMFIVPVGQDQAHTRYEAVFG